MSFRLQATQNGTEEKILDDLHNTSIDFVEDGNVPMATLSFTPRGKDIDVNYRVQTLGNITQQGTLRIEEQDITDAGKLIAYRLSEFKKQKLVSSQRQYRKPSRRRKKLRKRKLQVNQCKQMVQRNYLAEALIIFSSDLPNDNCRKISKRMFLSNYLRE